MPSQTRRPKIWTSEEQIISAIDRTKLMAQRRLKTSQELDEKAREKFGECERLRFELMTKTDGRIEDRLRVLELSAAATKEKADVSAKAYHRAMEKTLPRLGEILAAFRTQTMEPVMGEYRGVSVR